MGTVTNVTIPDIGDFKSVEVIEVLVSVGQSIRKEEPLVTLESEKASMDVPSPCSGTIVEVHASVGDEVSEGTLILLIEETGKAAEHKLTQIVEESEVESLAGTNRDALPEKPSDENVEHSYRQDLKREPASIDQNKPPSPVKELTSQSKEKQSHASPAVRKFGRQLGVNLEMVDGSGRKGRIIRSDIESFVKQQFQETSEDHLPDKTDSRGPQNLDFSQWGPVKAETLSRIQKRSGPRLLHAWTNVPHVTNHEEADITDLEAFRQIYKQEMEREHINITLLPFIMKTVSTALIRFPRINSSLASNQKDLILKEYIHIGFAVDTVKGLMVPVVKDVNKKTIHQLAIELRDFSNHARNERLKPEHIQGGTFTISSLGGIGGRGFTPIVNPPEVAILGVSRAKTMPEWNGTEFEPRLMLPLDLSYDHRVVDGATAARFLAFLKTSLEDIRRLLL